MAIRFNHEEQSALVDKLQRYFMRELDLELEQFDAEFLLDFISEHFGAYYYNRGLSDAQAVLQSRIDVISEAIEELEQPINVASNSR